MPRSFPAALAIVCFALPAGGPMRAAAQQTAQELRRRDVITRQEIEGVQVEDAYQVVLRLRPEFLNRASRAQPSLGLSRQPSRSATNEDPAEVGRTFDATSSPTGKAAREPAAGRRKRPPEAEVSLDRWRRAVAAPPSPGGVCGAAPAAPWWCTSATCSSAASKS